MERWRSEKPVHIGVIKRSDSASRWETIAKNGSIYRLNLSNQKRSEHVFACVPIFNSRNQKATQAHRKAILYDQKARLKADFTSSCEFGRKGRNALALGKLSVNGPIPPRSLIQRVWLFAKLSEKQNQSLSKNDDEKLNKFHWLKYITETTQCL